MNGTEGVTAVAWAVSRLLADASLVGMLGGAQAAPLRVLDTPLPDDAPTIKDDGTPLPWVTIAALEPQDIRVVGTIPIMALVEFQVKVSAATNTYGSVAPAYQRVHQLLDMTQGITTPTGLMLTCHRVSGIQLPEKVNGVQYRTLGGLYRTHIQ